MFAIFGRVRKFAGTGQVISVRRDRNFNGTCEVSDWSSRARPDLVGVEDLPYFADSIALVAIPGWDSSIYPSLSLQNSAAFYPP